MQSSEEEKTMRLEDWKRSGKSARACSKANGLNPQTSAGRARAETEAEPCFVEIPAQITPHQAQEILIEKGDVKIHIPPALGRSELRAVMEGPGAAL